MGNEIVKALSLAEEFGMTEDQTKLVKSYCARDATDDDLRLFLHYCKASGLDPLRKQAHFIIRKNKCQECYGKGCGKCDRGYIRVPTFLAGVDGLQARAERFPDYAGIMAAAVREGDEFGYEAGSGTVKHSFGAKRGRLIGAWATVARKGKLPCTVFVEAAEFMQDGGLWSSKPATMMEKTARSTALRRAFPEPFAGVYGEEEINMIDAPPAAALLATEPVPTIPDLSGRPAEAAPAGPPDFLRPPVAAFRGNGHISAEQGETLAKLCERASIKGCDLRRYLEVKSNGKTFASLADVSRPGYPKLHALLTAVADGGKYFYWANSAGGYDPSGAPEFVDVTPQSQEEFKRAMADKRFFA